MSYYILKDNTPVQTDLMTWAKWYGTANRHLDCVTIAGADVKISTVFLGLNHAFSDDEPPILFETMIFGGEHDQYQERYSTYADAEAGHIKAVAMVEESLKVKG